MRTTRRLLAYLLQQKGKIALGILFTLVMGVVEVLTGALFKVLIDVIPQIGSEEQVSLAVKLPMKELGIKNLKLFKTSLHGSDAVFQGLAFLCLVFFVFYVVQSLARYLRDVAFDAAIQRVLQRFKSDIYGKLLELPVAFFDQNKTGDLISRVTYDVAVLSRVIALFVELSRAGIFALVFVPVMLSINWRAALLTVVLYPLCYLLIRVISKHISVVSKATTDNVGDYTAFLEERVNGAKAVKAFNTEDRERKSFEDSIERNYRLNFRAICLTHSLKPLSDVLGIGGITLVTEV